MGGIAHYFHVRPFELDLLEYVHFRRLCAEVDEIRANNEASLAKAQAGDRDPGRRGARVSIPTGIT